jgi:hypothetical protein
MKRFLLKPRDPDPNIATNIKPDSTAEYGRYLVYAVTNCVACHTKFSLAKMDFDGPHWRAAM